MAREWLKELRKKHKYSQQFMAEQLGISRQYYCFVELGIRKDTLDMKMAAKLAKIFKLSLDRINKFESQRG